MSNLDKIAYYLDKHKYGVLITLVLHLFFFLYLQIATYQEAVLYEPWDFRSLNEEAPDNIEITPDQIETASERELFEAEEVTSFVKNEMDEREQELKSNQYYSSSTDNRRAQAMEDDYEQSLKDQIQKDRAEKNKNQSSSDIHSDKEEIKEDIPEFNFGKQASDKAVSGATMVSYSLSQRTPLNNNDWNIRNPGYTCGNVNGVVKIAIIVDKGGKVINATFVEAGSQNVNTCMKQKALEYAAMSRFNYADGAPARQEGTITYKFVYRN